MRFRPVIAQMNYFASAQLVPPAIAASLAVVAISGINIAAAMTIAYPGVIRGRLHGHAGRFRSCGLARSQPRRRPTATATPWVSRTATCSSSGQLAIGRWVARLNSYVCDLRFRQLPVSL